jgi:hypothetical protein
VECEKIASFEHTSVTSLPLWLICTMFICLLQQRVQTVKTYILVKESTLMAENRGLWVVGCGSRILYLKYKIINLVTFQLEGCVLAVTCHCEAQLFIPHGSHVGSLILKPRLRQDLRFMLCNIRVLPPPLWLPVSIGAGNVHTCFIVRSYSPQMTI